MLNAETIRALLLLDAGTRGVWLVRNDSGVKGKPNPWQMVADPFAQRWDWRAKVVGSPTYILQRYRAATKLRETCAGSRESVALARKLVDTMRQSARQSV